VDHHVGRRSQHLESGGKIDAMSTPTPVLAVTGATGQLGGRVARLLSATAAPQRLVVRDASRAPALAGAPGWQVDAWVSTYTAIAAGELERVSDAVADVAGRPPVGLDALLTRTHSEQPPTTSS
jgi:hypothetical protein